MEAKTVGVAILLTALLPFTAPVLSGGPIVEESRIDPMLLPVVSQTANDVEIDGDQLATIGSQGVVVSERSGDLWIPQVVLAFPQGFTNFSQVALSGAILAAVSPGPDAVVIWEKDGGIWRESGIVFAAAPAGLGQNVEIWGERVLAGSPGTNEVFVFQKKNGEWVEALTLLPPEPAFERFGDAIAASGETLMVSDTRFGAADVGTIFIYEESGLGIDYLERFQPSVSIDSQWGGRLELDGDRLFLIRGSRALYWSERVAGTWTLRSFITTLGNSAGKLDVLGETLLASDSDETAVARFVDGQWIRTDVLPVRRSANAGPGSFVAVPSGSLQVHLFRLEGNQWIDRGPLPDVVPASKALDLFGLGLAVSSDFLAIGAPRHRTSSALSGVVSLLRPLGAGWRLDTTLDEVLDERGLGGALAIDDGRLLVGSPFSGTASGRVHLVLPEVGGGWNATQLFAPVFAFDVAGTSVALVGDLALVGAPGRDTAGDAAGAAFVFERNSGTDEWVLTTTLLASDAMAGDRFGEAVAIADETLIVGAFSSDQPVVDGGAVYVFERSAVPVSDGPAEPFTETQKLLPFDIAASDSFGVALAISGDLLAVGANETTPVDAGSAYVFERSGPGQPYAEVQRLAATDGAAGDRLGRSVGFFSNGSRLAVGAPEHDAGIVDSDAGAIYVFEDVGGVWTEITKLTASDGRPGDSLGRTVAGAGDRLVTGLPLSDALAVDGGLAYSYRFYDDTTDAADLSVGLVEDADPVAAGESVTYTATVTNAGAVVAPATQLVFEVSSSLVPLSTSGCAEDPLGFPLCTLGAVAASSAVDVEIVVSSDMVVETETSVRALVHFDAPNASPFDDEATQTTTLESRSDLQLQLTAPVGPVRAGQLLRYEVAVTAGGPSTSREVTLDLQLPAEAEFVDIEGCSNAVQAGETCLLGWIDVDSTETVTARVWVPLGTVGPLDFVATAASTSAETAPGDETSMASTAVDTTPWASFVEIHRQGVGGVDGLGDPEDVAISGNARYVFVVGASGRIAIFEKEGAGCRLSFVNALSSGSVDVVTNASGSRVMTAGSPDTLLFYSMQGGDLTLLDTVENNVDGVLGLSEITDLAFSNDVLAVSAADPGSILIFSLNADGLGLTFGDVSFESGPSSTPLDQSAAVAIDGNVAVVSSSDRIFSYEVSPFTRLFERDSAFMQVPASAVSVDRGGQQVFAAGPDSSVVQSWLFEGTGTITAGGSLTGPGVGGVRDIGLDPSGGLVLTAAADENALGIFVRNPTQLLPTLAELLVDGVDGVDGLEDASSLIISPTARCVYVTSVVEDSLAVFELDRNFSSPFFTDGFESGDTSVWSLTVP